MNDKSGTKGKLLDREIVTTADGSTSIWIPAMDEMYHSHKGAINESLHVYIENGFKQIAEVEQIAILEVGMGTGLNVLLTYLESQKSHTQTFMTTLEPYPLSVQEYENLNFDKQLGLDSEITQRIHKASFDALEQFGELFILEKKKCTLEDFEPTKKYNLVYFDAFAPNKQASPWQISNLEKVYHLLETGGILTTYCSQGQFKRDLKSIGFEVTNPEGPMAKREITVAIKK